MPERVINDAVFQYKDAEGRLVTAARGEKVDIPEGPDLARGDKWGAFTPDGKEPKAPEGSFVPDIEAEWSDEEYVRFVDAATADEVVAKLNEVSDENRPEIARRLIEAESSRGDTAREELLTSLTQVAESPSTPATGNATNEEPGEPEEGGEGAEGEDLVEFVSTNTVEAVLERAGDDRELAAALREAEESRGADKARKGVIEGLTKIENVEA